MQRESQKPEDGAIRPERWEFFLRAAAGVGIAALYAIGIFLLWQMRHVVLLAFTGILLAVFLQTLAQWLHRHARISYGISLAIVVLVLLALAGAMGWIAGSSISRQVGQLSDAFRVSLGQLQKQLQESAWGQTIVNHLFRSEQGVSGGAVVAQAVGVASSVFQAVVDGIVVAFVGLFLAAQPAWYIRGLLHLVPKHRRERANEVLDRVGSALRWWLLAQLFAMVVVGILTGVGLWLVGSRLPLALALVAFAFQIIPNVGPFLSAVPAIVLAWTDSPMKAVYVICVFLVIHLIEGYILTPVVEAKTIRLPPALYIVAILVFQQLAGLLGVLVTAPLLVSLMVLIRSLYVEDVLGDDTATPEWERRAAT